MAAAAHSIVVRRARFASSSLSEGVGVEDARVPRDDAAEICALVAAFATRQQATADAAALANFLRDGARDDKASYFTLVVEKQMRADEGEGDEHELIGYAMCCLGVSSYKGGHTLNLHDIYVADGYRSDGIGQRLMDEVIREAHARGCAKLTLEAHELNTGAIRFYERNGFESWDMWDTAEKGRTLFYGKVLKSSASATHGGDVDDDQAGLRVRMARFRERADDDDTEAVCALVSAFATQVQTTADTTALAQFLRDDASAEICFTLVAEKEVADEGDEFRVVGYAMCCLGVSSFKGRCTLNLHDIYVADGYRSDGIGQRLMDEVIREAHARGCAKLTLEAHELNTGAIRFYERNGFESWDVWDTAEKGRTLFYGKVLKSSASATHGGDDDDVDDDQAGPPEAAPPPPPPGTNKDGHDGDEFGGGFPEVPQPETPAGPPASGGDTPGAAMKNGDDDDDFGDFGDFSNGTASGGAPSDDDKDDGDDDFGDFGDFSNGTASGGAPSDDDKDDGDDDFGDFGDFSNGTASGGAPSDDGDDDFGDFGDSGDVQAPPSAVAREEDGIPPATSAFANGSVPTDAVSIRTQLSLSLSPRLPKRLGGAGGGDASCLEETALIVKPGGAVSEYVERISARAQSSPRSEKDIEPAAMKSLTLPAGGTGRHVVSASHDADLISMEIMLIENS